LPAGLDSDIFIHLTGKLAFMKITILGCGTSTGVPMVGCSCRVCSSDDPRDKRSRASILIRHQERNILVDTSTDLRTQALRQGIDAICAVFISAIETSCPAMDQPAP
jgi:phosphoribosyl 1,2-cyclic phosphodiesterase